MMISDEPISSDDGEGDDPVTHDVDDDAIVVDPDGSGSSEPGSGGDGTLGDDGREPSQSEPVPPSEEKPAEEEVAEGPPVEQTTTEETAPEPVSEGGEIYDQSVHVSLPINVTFDGGDEVEVYVDTGIYCALADAGAPGEDSDERAFEAMPISAPADGAAAGDRTAAIVSASVLLGAMGLILGSMALRRRKLLA